MCKECEKGSRGLCQDTADAFEARQKSLEEAAKQVITEDHHDCPRDGFVMVYCTDAERTALQEIADQDIRNIAEQARYFIVQALKARGKLGGVPMKFPAQHDWGFGSVSGGKLSGDIVTGARLVSTPMPGIDITEGGTR